MKLTSKGLRTRYTHEGGRTLEYQPEDQQHDAGQQPFIAARQGAIVGDYVLKWLFAWWVYSLAVLPDYG